jgi:hypothetical protein
MSLRGLALRVLVVLAGSLPVACSGPRSDPGSSNTDLTGVTSAQRGFHFQSYVYVPTTASDADIQTAIAREVKSAIGPLRTPEVAFNDLNAENNLDPKTWTRTTLTVVDPTNPGATPTQVVRITFPYNDVAVVTDSLSGSSAVDFVMLADDYSRHYPPLLASCSDDTTVDVGSFWYDYDPTLPACQTLIENELSAIQTEEQALGSNPMQIGPHEAARWFMPATARLDPPSLPGQDFSPEYDRLYGVGTSKSQVIVYAFAGVDSDETNPDDILGQEAIKFLRTMLATEPNFRPVNTKPFAMLEDISVNGQPLANVTYDQMFSWLVDKTGYPPEVGTDPNLILALRQQAMAKFTERWIYWDLPVTVTDASGSARPVTIEVRSFYGYEVGSPQIQQEAQWRYLEAFWYGDVFMYTGHSHFGNGPLEPFLYGPQNFNTNYQIMLVNSCISYNYYHQDFLDMKPGGTKNLDMVVNGLPAYVQDMGIASANFLTSLIDGRQHNYVDLLRAMELNEPWDSAYDPMRVVDGELDNTFSQAKTPLSVTVLPPVYP